MTTTTRRIALWAAATAWSAVIFLLSSVPGSRLPARIPPEVGHLGEYFVLGALLYLALRVDLSPRTALALAVVIASAYGVTDEFHQRFVVLRTPDVYDWVTDTLGAAAGAGVAFFVSRRLTNPIT
ncbi:MAG: VanZ family protein [Acidimicrobiales bacterium]|nr:VanZ family protein [Acidimicrobiales bacterium]